MTNLNRIKIDFSTVIFYGLSMQVREPLKKAETWQKTNVQNLVRHKNKTYYARAYSEGKEIWKSLKTSSISVAKARLSEFLQDHRKKASRYEAAFKGKMSVGDAIELHKKKLKEDVKIKPSTRHYWTQVIAALQKSWPQLAETDIRKVTKGDCKAWATKFAREASSTRFNNTVAALRHILEIAVEAGARYDNPASVIKRVRVRQKQLILPNTKQFLSFVQAIETAGGWCSRDCADFVRFLAFSGCRKSEAAQVEWNDVDFAKGELIIRGDPQTGTKNWEVRRVPLIPPLRELLEKLHAQQKPRSMNVKVLKVNESQGAMNSAAKAVGCPRLTHHDLRHFFATICIESGVDIPTVSRWLGHKDGGALAMKVYGHLRNEHSIAAAQKVTLVT